MEINEPLNKDNKWTKEILDKVIKKMEIIAVRSRDKLPYGYDENMRHIDMSKVKPNWWTNGFFGGTCAMLYSYTKNEEFFKTLEKSEELLDEAFKKCFDIIHHDVGFMWHITSGAKYRFTKDYASKRRLFYAASTLMGRFILGGNFIKAWNVEEAHNWTIIDTMMNLPLLYWASKEFNDDRYKRVAMAHADNALLYHIREDGSVNHIVEHDRDTGKMICSHAGQGYAVGSSWSRGVSWALYGYVISYIHTGEERYLKASQKVADYFMSECKDYLPRLDFKAPKEPVYYDSTAGAIASCGLLELGKILSDGAKYTDFAVKMMKKMTEEFCNFDLENDYILGYGSEFYPHNEEDIKKTNIPIIYGDFFYIEALLKIVKHDLFMW